MACFTGFWPGSGQFDSDFMGQWPWSGSRARRRPGPLAAHSMLNPLLAPQRLARNMALFRQFWPFYALLGPPTHEIGMLLAASVP